MDFGLSPALEAARGRRIKLHTELVELEKEHFNLRFQLATGQLDDSSSIKKVRHEIARIATVMRQRDFAAAVADAEAGAAGTESGTESER